MATIVAAALFARTGFIDSQAAAIEVALMQAVHGGMALRGAAHRHKAEPSGAAGLAIDHDLGIRDGAKRSERILQVVLGGIEGKISYVESHSELMVNKRTDANEAVPGEAGFQITTETSSPEDLPRDEH